MSDFATLLRGKSAKKLPSPGIEELTMVEAPRSVTKHKTISAGDFSIIWNRRTTLLLEQWSENVDFFFFVGRGSDINDNSFRSPLTFKFSSPSLNLII